MAQPELVMRRLCTFLALPWSDQLLSHHERAPQRLEEHRARIALDGRVVVSREQRLHQQHRTMERPGTGRIGSWRQEFDADELLRFERVAGGLLHELGYALHHHPA